jgi:hypothetical protein
VPKTLVFDTPANHPDFCCQKPRSKPKWLLNVFASIRASEFGLISVHFGCAFDIMCSLSRNMPKMHTRIACSSVHRRCHYGYTLNDVNGPELPLVRNASNDRSQPQSRHARLTHRTEGSTSLQARDQRAARRKRTLRASVRFFCCANAANGGSEPKLSNAAVCTNVRYHEQSHNPSTTD